MEKEGLNEWFKQKLADPTVAASRRRASELYGFVASLEYNGHLRFGSYIWDGRPGFIILEKGLVVVRRNKKPGQTGTSYRIDGGA
jgi:hypothetical protein